MNISLTRLRLVFRKLWVRVTAISAFAVLAVLAAKLVGPLIPADFAAKVGADAVGNLLEIIANSMLTVTTFSLSVMVTVHLAVSSQWTPRAHRVHLQDNRTQTVLATFIGAYIYALLSLILLDIPDFYGDGGIVALFFTTLIVIALIVAAMMRWIVHLQGYGSLRGTAEQIVDQAVIGFAMRLANPSLGANPLTESSPRPVGARVVAAPMSGYVQRILVKSLQAAAEKHDALIRVLPAVGEFVAKGAPLAEVTGKTTDLDAAILAAVDLGPERSSDQDPLFAMISMAEIGMKALSPGINDTGTAIDMINRIAMVWDTDAGAAMPAAPSVWIKPFALDKAALVPFDMIARDGATKLEVGVALLDRLSALAKAHPQVATDFARVARMAYERGQEAIPHALDRARLARPDWAYVPEFTE